MAIRTKEESRESVVRPRISETGGSGGSSFDDAIELGGRSDCADGRRLGNVLMEPVTAVPVDLELNVAMLLALEDASLAILDCIGGFGGGVARSTRLMGSLVLDSKSGIVGMLSSEEIDSLVV